MSTEELAKKYAERVVSGSLGWHEAYKLMKPHVSDFGTACMEINIAVGNLKAGE